MATSDVNLAERSGSLVESHKGRDPRILFFHAIFAVLLVVLTGGMAYQQLFKTGIYNEAERRQNQRRVIVPGPRGNIYDREGRVLVGNEPRFSVVLYVDELRAELREEVGRIKRNYAAGDSKDVPTRGQLERIARVSVTQKYLDEVIRILQRDPASPEAKVDARRLQRHFHRELLLPYTLLDELSSDDYARLIERLPVNSPVQVYSSSSRHYPYGSAAAHTLGYVRYADDLEAEDFPGSDLPTFKMKGATGKDGLEKQFDDILQGTAGGSIFRVDPSGYRIDPPLEQRKPQQGRNITTSLDIDLQVQAEQAIGDQRGAAVAIDVATGEVLVLASKPDYDLNAFSPRATQEIVDQMNKTGAWNNLATTGALPPGSTFKILTSIAGLHHGALHPERPIVDCQAYHRVGNKLFPCFNGRERHGEILLRDAIAYSCDIYYYKAGELVTPDVLAAEARRFHLDRPLGIELPSEPKNMLVPDTKWKRATVGEPWYPGDTANMAIGQGFTVVSPLGMACFMASLGRGETFTKPYLLHDPSRPRQRSEPIGLTREQLRAVYEGMEGCTTYGSAKLLTQAAAFRIPGVKIAAKTGTAQKLVTRDGKTGFINYAWFVCFAPIENPQIAMAVVIEGQEIGEETLGGMYAAPIAATVMQTYFAKKARPAQAPTPLFRKS